MRKFCLAMLCLSLLTIKGNAQEFEILAEKVNADLEDAVKLNNVLYFGANDGIHGFELWQSDGSKAGTKMLKDIKEGTRFDSGDPHNFKLVSNHFVFISRLKNESFNRLFYSDGSVAGTTHIQEVRYPVNLTVIDNIAYFIGTDLNNSRYNLYQFTPSTKKLVKLIENLSNDADEEGVEVVQKNGRLFFSFEKYLHEIKNEKAEILIDYSKYHAQWRPIVWDINSNGFYLFFNDRSNKGENDLVFFANSDKSLKLLKRFYSYNFRYTSANRAVFNDAIYFSADDGNYGTEMWKSDGTSAGTVRLTDFNPGGGSSILSHFFFDDHVLFTAQIETRYISNKPNKLYLLKLSNEQISEVKTPSGQSFIQLYFDKKDKLGDSKLYFDGTYFQNPKDSLVNFSTKKESRYFLYDLDNEKIVDAPQSINTYKVVRENNKWYYVLDEFCSIKRINSLNSISSQETTEFHFDNRTRSPSAVVEDFQLLKNGVIASKLYDESVYTITTNNGIYFVESCSGFETSIKSETGKFDLCKGSTLKVEAISSGNVDGLKYNWYGSCFDLDSTSKISIDQNIPINSFTGNRTLMLVAENNKGCIKSETKRVNLVENDLKVEISGSVDVCPPENEQLIALTQGGNGLLSYQWINENGDLLSSNSDSLAINSPGKYTVKITDDYGCKKTSYFHEVRSKLPQSFTLVSEDGNNILKTENTDPKFIKMNRFTDSGETVRWYLDNTLLSAENDRYAIQVTAPGTYKAVVKNDICTSTVESEITIYLITATELIKPQAAIYPNPAQTYVQLPETTENGATIKLLDILGRAHYVKFDSLNKRLNVSALLPGEYILNIDQINNYRQSFRFVKE